MNRHAQFGRLTVYQINLYAIKLYLRTNLFYLFCDSTKNLIFGENILKLATEQKDWKFVKELILQGADYQSALFYACKTFDYEFIRYYFSVGADPFLPSKSLNCLDILITAKRSTDSGTVDESNFDRCTELVVNKMKEISIEKTNQAIQSNKDFISQDLLKQYL